MYQSTKRNSEINPLELHMLLIALSSGGISMKQFLEDATNWAKAIIEDDGDKTHATRK